MFCFLRNEHFFSPVHSELLKITSYQHTAKLFNQSPIHLFLDILVASNLRHGK